jgi:hypothetical protein
LILSSREFAVARLAFSLGLNTSSPKDGILEVWRNKSRARMREPAIVIVLTF